MDLIEKMNLLQCSITAVELQRAKMFCILDLLSAYQQVVFEKINKDLTVFIT